VVPPSSSEEQREQIHVLVVDDESALRRSLARILVARGFRVGTAEEGHGALEYMERHRPDVALVDLMMPGLTGLEVLSQTKERQLDTEVIMMTAFADVDSAVAAVKAGAYDFLTKPFASNDAVALAVSKAAERRRLLERTNRLERELLSRERFGELIGTSTKMQAVYRLIEGVAAATSNILVLGESGTGKELVARAIHQYSSRAAAPFVPVNCAAIPKDLVESELFGHVRGAFTGAQSSRAGLFESADRGTIFLDEVGDLPLAAQVKLLRTLQEGEVKRVGSDETRVVDVRVVAATNVDLKAKADRGEFRHDLYYRLNVIAIHLPPLREREGDVLLLATHFLAKLALRMNRPPKPLSEAAEQALLAYPWPGNVRELEHAIEHAFVLSRGESIVPGDLPFRRERALEPAPREIAGDLASLPYAEAKREALQRFDAAYVEALLAKAGGNLSTAARFAGLDRSNFRRIVRKVRA
jgi:DNA-binding NtrC family response regulator